MESVEEKELCFVKPLEPQPQVIDAEYFPNTFAPISCSKHGSTGTIKRKQSVNAVNYKTDLK